MDTYPDDPVYPSARSDNTGINLREHMATHIMAGFAADPNCGHDCEGTEHDHAVAAVRWADALIDALNRTKEVR